jgi:hypothetical protein
MKQDAWITAGTAAKILEERFGRPVRVDYVTKLGRLNRLRTQHMGSRIVLYNRNDVEQIQIKTRTSAPRAKQQEEVKPQEPVAEERPWYLPDEQEKEKENTEDKSEADAA